MRSFVVLLLMTLYFPVSGQSQRWKGYPDKTYDRDLLKHFASPPAGYGNVPFYWWNGDSLRRERLQEQLEFSPRLQSTVLQSAISTPPRVSIHWRTKMGTAFWYDRAGSTAGLLRGGGRSGTGSRVKQADAVWVPVSTIIRWVGTAMATIRMNWTQWRSSGTTRVNW